MIAPMPVQSTKRNFKQTPRVLNILYTNARSIVKKLDELKATVYELQPDMILICESWTHSEITKAFLAIDGYSMEGRMDRKDTMNGKGGGLLAYFKDGMKATVDEINERDAFNQCCLFRIPWDKMKNLFWHLLIAHQGPK